MKKCPTCHCITEEECECHVCGTTIIYEPSAYAEERERLEWNTYTRRYLFRKLWFSVLSIIVVAVLIVLSLPLEPLNVMQTITVEGYKSQVSVHNSDEQYLWAALFFAVLSLIAAILERPAARWMQWKYNSEYAAARAGSQKYLLGIVAILSALVIVISEIV